ncbi:MAG: Uma2 family endonuclease [Dehalococcoidia bacterium]|nr:Uma2 family endonuclease [Dehalococcoidia bacterium]
MLEVASASTAERDLGSKRDDYAAFGIPEYWRFDETGEHYGERLAGERLVEGEYRPIEIANLAGGILQGRSDVLALDLRWHDGRLEWYAPGTGRHIATFDDERAARIQAETRVERAEARADTAEARSRQLEEELRRLRGE